MRWRAGRIGAVLAAALTVAGAAGWFALDAWKHRPQAVTAYQGFKLGDTQDEVFYALGAPEYVILRPPPRDDDTWSTYSQFLALEDIPPGSSHRDYREWLFSHEAPRLRIAFDAPNGRIVEISCISGTADKCPPLFGLRDGASEDDVRQRLGPPADEEIRGSLKRMRYPALNFTAYLEKRRVVSMRVSKPGV